MSLQNSVLERSEAGGVLPRIKRGLASIGFSPLGLVLIVIVAVLPFVPPFNQEHILRWLIMGAFLAAQAVAFDFTAGYINVVNFGFAAILGVGAYTSAILANTSPVLAVQPGISPWIGIWVGALLAGIIGLGLGILTLRLRGIFAAVMAWFVGIALMGLVRNLTPLTRGPLGMAPRSLLETTSNRPYFYVILAMLLVVYITLKLVTRSKYGLAFKAIGQNFDAARASHEQDGGGAGAGVHRRQGEPVGRDGRGLSLCVLYRGAALEPVGPAGAAPGDLWGADDPGDDLLPGRAGGFVCLGE